MGFFSSKISWHTICNRSLAALCIVTPLQGMYCTYGEFLSESHHPECKFFHMCFYTFTYFPLGNV